MPTLRDELQQRLKGRVCLVGVGNPERGDDGFGVRLAEAMRDLGHRDVIVAAREPERWTGHLVRGGFQTVLFLDAVQINAAPGAAVFLESAQIAARYPQVSTHRLSLGMLARLIESESPARVCLLGVQPGSLDGSGDLSAPVRTTLEILRDVLTESLTAPGKPMAVGGVPL